MNLVFIRSRLIGYHGNRVVIHEGIGNSADLVYMDCRDRHYAWRILQKLNVHFPESSFKHEYQRQFAILRFGSVLGYRSKAIKLVEMAESDGDSPPPGNSIAGRVQL